MKALDTASVLKSKALYDQALNFFPGGVNSPVRAFRAVQGTPIFFKKGKGSHLWDEDDNRYIDYCCSWGALILGHAHPEVVAAVQHQVALGTSYGAPTALENQLAATILQHHSFVEKMRFVNSGTEAVMSAIRLARGYTGRNKIVKFEGCYHGHSDALLVNAGSGLVTFGQSSSAGVTAGAVADTLVLPLDNEAAIDEVFSKHGQDIAAVVIEPIPANNGLLLQRPEYLQHLRDTCSQHGSLLLFDEVISGFRIGFEGAAGHYDITPDLVTYGKVIGGGLPVGAYASTNEIMGAVAPDGEVYQAGTLSGNPVAMAAGYAQMAICLQEGFYSEIEMRCRQLCDAVNDAAKGLGLTFQLVQQGAIFWPCFSSQPPRAAHEIKTEDMQHFPTLYHALLEEGIYLGPSGYEVGFVSASHTDEDIQRTIAAFSAALERICAS